MALRLVFMVSGLLFPRVFTVEAAQPQTYHQEVTLTGLVSCSHCRAFHNHRAATPLDCARKCVRDGSDYELVVTKPGHTEVYKLQGDKSQFDQLAGGKAIITGQLAGVNTLQVASARSEGR